MLGVVACVAAGICSCLEAGRYGVVQAEDTVVSREYVKIKKRSSAREYSSYDFVFPYFSRAGTTGTRPISF